MGDDDGLGAVAEGEFDEDVGDVGLDRGLGQVECGGQLGVAQALGEQAQDVEFAGCEGGQLAVPGGWF